MHRTIFLFAVLIIASAVLLASCGTAAPQSSTFAKPTEGSQAKSPAKVNLDEIFPSGPGRILVLSNCTNCHSITPIVVLRFTKEAWERNSRDHRERVTALNDADFKALYDYLIVNFNPDKPVPDLPKELLDTWTSY